MRRNARHAAKAPVRVGLVGAGAIANHHVGALRALPGVALEAVCDTTHDRAVRLAAVHEIARAHGSLEDMLAAGPLDVVHVLTPPPAHESPAAAALEAGADVLAEKPLCNTGEACRRLREQARRLGRTLGCSHNFLFVPAYERLVAHLREGRLGAIDQLDIVWNKPLGSLKVGPYGAWMLQHPDNVLFEIAPHCFAHVVHLVGRPDRIVVHPWDPIDLPRGPKFWRRWEVLAWKGASSVRVRLSFIDGYPEHSIHLRGTQAIARCDFETGTYVCTEHTSGVVDLDRFLAVGRASRDSLLQAGGTLATVALAKLGMNRRGGPFQQGITSAVAAFHAGRGPERTLDERVRPALAEEAVALAEWVAREADLPAPTIRPTRPPSGGGSSPDVLVIGGTGFIGRRLVRHLCLAGRRVRLLARDPSGVPAALFGTPIEAVRGDIADPESVAAAMSGIDLVFHLARGSGKTWREYIVSDVAPTLTVADLCLEQGVRRLVYSSSIALYDAGRGAPTITEHTPPMRSGDPYARSKIENEANLLAMHAERGLPLVIVRPGIVVGAGASPLHWGVAAWPYPSLAVLRGSGDEKLPFVLVDDCADAILRAGLVAGIEGRSYNLVGPALLTANEYLDELEARAGVKLGRISKSSWRWLAEALGKWAMKRIGRDPGARWPRRVEWEGLSYAAGIDGMRAVEELGWRPCTSRDLLVQDGVWAASDAWFERDGLAPSEALWPDAEADGPPAPTRNRASETSQVISLSEP